MKIPKSLHLKRTKTNDEMQADLTDLRIVEQALNALEDANRRFESDFELWRKEWRAKLGMLDVRNAQAAMAELHTDKTGLSDFNAKAAELSDQTMVQMLSKDTGEDPEEAWKTDETTAISEALLPYDFEYL